MANEQDPNGIEAHAPGAKLDAGKPMVWLCLSGFSNALKEVAKVTTVGAKKYSPNGWKEVADGPQRYMDAFGRHALELGSGNVIDQDTGCLHKAQMIWNLLASLELELQRDPEIMDRAEIRVNQVPPFSTASATFEPKGFRSASPVYPHAPLPDPESPQEKALRFTRGGGCRLTVD